MPTKMSQFVTQTVIPNSAYIPYVYLGGNYKISYSNFKSTFVIGPIAATNNGIAVYDGISGKLIKDTSVTIDGSGNIFTPSQIKYVDANTYITRDGGNNLSFTDAITGTKTLAQLAAGAPGDVVGPGSSTDNAIARYDLITGKIIQNSVVLIDDSGNISGVGNITLTGNVDGVDVSAFASAYTSHASDSTIHFTVGSISHTAIQNIGSNTHAQIDTHLGSTSNPHSVTHAQLGGVTSDQHHNKQHGLGSSLDHTSATLAQLNALISDATISANNNKEVLYFGPDTFNNNDNYYACANIAGTGAKYFTIVIPSYALTIEEINLIGYANGTVSGVDIDFFSNYGADSESITNHSESDTTSTYNFTIDQHTVIDLLSAVFTGISAGDRGGIYMDANGTGMTFRNLAVEVVITK